MRKYILLFLLLAVGLSPEVYGQKVNRSKSYPTQKAYYPYGYEPSHPLLPQRDTVIIRGEEIEVGSYLSTQWHKSFEIIGYGKAKKSDYKKKFDRKKGIFDNKYSIKLKPKHTTTYEFRWIDWRGYEEIWGRKVYVAKTEEGRKRMQKQLNKILGRQYTTYQYVNPDYNVKVGFSSKK